MAIDLEAIRRKHEELKKESGFSDSYLVLKVGTNYIRILPGKDDETLFYAETALHRLPAQDGEEYGKAYHCPRVQSEPCPKELLSE